MDRSIHRALRLPASLPTCIILIFLGRRSPFDPLDFVFLFQGVGQRLVDRHGEAIGILAECDSEEFALEVTRSILVLNLENEEAAITIFGNIVVANGLLVVYLNTVARYLKRIAVSICPITEIGCCLFFFLGSRDPGGRHKQDREKRQKKANV